MTARVIAVFGGSRAAVESSEYAEAYAVGKLLAEAGYVVLNGGYAGTMEASARGAKENGGRAIGVLSGEFGLLTPNGYLDETVQHRDLFDRVRDMQARSDAFIVLKGSMGTLAELMLVWNLSKVHVKHRKPIILVGESWVPVLASWRQHLAVTGDEAELLQVVKTPKDVMDVLQRAFNGRSNPFPSSPSP